VGAHRLRPPGRRFILPRMQRLVFGAAVLGVLMATAGASAHIALDAPPMRDAAMKTRPCGGSGTRSATPAVFAPGQRVTVKWHETVVHPGFFRVAFSTDGTTFPADPTDPPPAVAAPVLAIIPKVDGITQYSTDITLPSTPCETCTIQVIQYMRQHAPPPYYYQCADIAIRAGGGSGAGGTGNAGGAPSGGATSAGADAGSSPSTSQDDGGCAVATHQASPLPGLFLVALGVMRFLVGPRRRRLWREANREAGERRKGV
jgi:hypothetical protein